jgi:glycosyltransferase involved in cell wall biosynthesis
MSKLRVCLDARLISGSFGGVEQFIIGLASGLSKLAAGDEEYYFLTYAGADAWLRPYLQGACRLLQGPEVPETPFIKNFLKPKLSLLLPIWHHLFAFFHLGRNQLMASDGTIERAGIDVMHFTKQDAFLTNIPSIYQPHDLMHLHVPECCNPRERVERENIYRAFCQQASLLAVMTEWGKEDLIKQYGLLRDKVAVVPHAPLLPAYPEPSHDQLAWVKEKFSLPPAFIFYPAHSWPHKNHLGLLEALAILRDRYDMVAPLVCSGGATDFFKKIKQKAQMLKLTDQVNFLGFVSTLELQCLYRLCCGVIFPSKFEGWGLPLMEAFWAGAPVACSNVTCLPKMVGKAAIIFDPYNPAEMARSIYRLWTDETLRRELIKRGQERARPFTWERTARIFRAHYRRLTNSSISDEDLELVVEPPLV